MKKLLAKNINNMDSLIIGSGEIGKALYNILITHYPTFIRDIVDIALPGNFKTEILHLCYPYSGSFISDTQAYIKQYKPKYTIIHSTVPLGTSRICNALHSPIRGLHPHLVDGIKTFVKYIGGEQASEVADYFRRAGLKVCLFDKQETTEALKLFDTEYYKTCIKFAQRVKKYCDDCELNFSEIYRLPNITYNEGYTKLKHPEFIRPVLEPIMKPIGGHCVEPNSKLLKLSERDEK